MNPCPCGWFGHKKRRCACSPDRIEKYRGKLSGPLLDRIELQISLPAVDSHWMDAQPGETSEPVRSRVRACRQRQRARQACSNAMLGVEGIGRHCRLDGSAQDLLRKDMVRWDWSARVVHRSEEHTSELQSLMRNSYAVFFLTNKTLPNTQTQQ